MSNTINMDNPKCAKCYTFPDDLLMMSCAHDLCLQCAALLLTRNLPNKSIYKNILMCSICRQQTTLEPESIIQLARLLPAQNHLQSVLPNSQYQQAQFNSSNTRPVAQTFEPIRNSLCRQHPQQMVNYFCFDCKCPCICAECIIHGIHKDHDVRIVKKAFPVIKQEVEKHIGQSEKLCRSLQIKKLQLQNKLRQCSDKSQNLKKEVRGFFRGLRDKLATIEAQAILKCQQQMKEYKQSILKSYTSVQLKIKQLNENQRSVRNLYSMPQVKLINYYAENMEAMRKRQELTDLIGQTAQKQPQIARVFNEKLQGIINNFWQALK